MTRNRQNRLLSMSNERTNGEKHTHPIQCIVQGASVDGTSGSFIRRNFFTGFLFFHIQFTRKICFNMRFVLISFDFSGENFSADNIWGSKSDFRQFCPPKFCPIRYTHIAINPKAPLKEETKEKPRIQFICFV